MELTDLFEYEAAAKERMAANDWDYVSAGAQDDTTLRRNESAFHDIRINPRFLVDVSERELSTTVLGHRISFPIMTASSGPWYYAHPEAEAAVAKAAGRADTIAMMPTNAGVYSFRETAEQASGPLMLQLYHYGDEITEHLVTTARDAGCAAICLTVDIPIRKVIDKRLARSRALVHELLGRGNLRDRPDLLQKVQDSSNIYTLPWSRLDWLKSLTDLPLVLKGIRTVDDAVKAVDHGVDGIIVSTHGGRYLDGSPAPIEVLPDIADAVDDQIEVYMDSGIRRGTDVLKALASGARAVFIGRPVYWGLAVDGEDGVYKVLEILRDEFDLAMAYCGITRVEDIDRRLLSWK